ncbi:hypothetical protein OsccyDRAFT_0563 [Leptolyngbyaceae cyanobacterium JSC-12]|nr:hypothetical protein OsccyDRAFT_0563 [Leptolyngbyaceae cyanobacterium JSC-12]
MELKYDGQTIEFKGDVVEIDVLLSRRQEMKELSNSSQHRYKEHVQQLATLAEVYQQATYLNAGRMLAGAQPTAALPPARSEFQQPVYQQEPVYQQQPHHQHEYQNYAQPHPASFPLYDAPVSTSSQPVYQSPPYELPTNVERHYQDVTAQAHTVVSELSNLVAPPGAATQNKNLYARVTGFIDYLLLRHPRLYGIAVALLVGGLLLAILTSPKIKKPPTPPAALEKKEVPAEKKEQPKSKEGTGTPPDEPPSLQ